MLGYKNNIIFRQESLEFLHKRLGTPSLDFSCANAWVYVFLAQTIALAIACLLFVYSREWIIVIIESK